MSKNEIKLFDLDEFKTKNIIVNIIKFSSQKKIKSIIYIPKKIINIFFFF